MRPIKLAAAGSALLLFTGLGAAAHASDNPAPLWDSVQAAGSTGLDEAIAVDVLPSGSPVVVGNFAGTAHFPTGPGDDSIALVSSGQQSVFVALMDPAGDYFTWAIAAGGTGGFSTVADVAAVGADTPSMSDDRVVIAGTFDSGSQMLFPGPNGDIPLTRYGTIDMYYASLVPGSGFTRVTRIGQPEPYVSSGTALPTSIAIAPDGRVILAGSFEGMIRFPKTTGSLTLSTSESSYQTFIAGMNLGTLNDKFAWAQQAGGPASLQSVEVASDPVSGRLTLAGTASTGVAYFPTGRPSPDDSIALLADDTPSLFITSMSYDDTYFDWVQSAGGAGPSQPRALATTPDGDLLIGGSFGRTITVPQTGGGSISLSAASAQLDGFVASMGEDDSTFAWATPVSSSATDYVNALAVAPDGTTLATGGFEGALTLPAASGAITLPTALGEPDAFVAAMAPGSPYFSWVQVARGQSDSDGATPNGIVFTSATQAVIAGKLKGSMTFPTPAGSATLTRRGIFDAFTASISLPQAPAVPPAPIPADPPRAVTAVAGDASASASWTAPASAGSYPVSHYLVTSSPGGRTCLAAAPTLSCDVTGLSNGTSYTFTVKALTGAGWSAASEPSNAVTPRATPRPTIVIAGSREGKRIVVSGTRTGMGMGALVTPWTSRSLGDFMAGRPVVVSMDGSFTWSRKASPSAVWRIYFTAEGAKSNTVAIR